MNERLELLAKDVKTRERNADTYASRPPGGGGKGGGGGGDNLTLQSIKANLAAADNDIKSVDKRIGTLESQKKNQSRVEREVTDGKIAELELNKKELSKRKTEYQTQLGTFTSARTGTAAPAAAAATGSRPALSTFNK
jgi:archaellum component FlaC